VWRAAYSTKRINRFVAAFCKRQFRRSSTGATALLELLKKTKAFREKAKLRGQKILRAKFLRRFPPAELLRDSLFADTFLCRFTGIAMVGAGAETCAQELNVHR
jgi:hypothetical protein